MNQVHVFLPAGTDDPERPSGGHRYNRSLCLGLAVAGWAVFEHHVPGAWPLPDAAAEQALAAELGEVEDDTVVLIDGLIASAAARIVLPVAARLPLVVLVHMLLGEPAPGQNGTDLDRAREQERHVLSAARAVVTTSGWTRARLLDRYAVRPANVHASQPGAWPAPLVPGTAGGGELLCVGAVAPAKGQDVLLDALAKLRDRAWRCRLVGPLDRDARFAAQLRDRAAISGIEERVDFVGPLPGEALDRAYAQADVLVLASHAETYGMVVTEALAHGLPVIATAVGGVAEALGSTPDGRLPGLLVPPADVRALRDALGSWLDDSDRRRRLREAARDRRPTVPTWDDTCARVGSVLAGVAARPAVESGAT
jgi:glycosyltransferase involved in cell wall biosynthesis